MFAKALPKETSLATTVTNFTKFVTKINFGPSRFDHSTSHTKSTFGNADVINGWSPCLGYINERVRYSFRAEPAAPTADR